MRAYLIVIALLFSSAAQAGWAIFQDASSSAPILILTMTQSDSANNDNTYNMGPGGNDVGTDGANPYMAVNNAADGGATWSYSLGIYSDFPNHTTWSWTTSVASGGSTGTPLSYEELAYGYPNPGCFPGGANPATPYHPSAFATQDVTLTFNLTVSTLGDASDIDWLIETWSANNTTPTYAPGCVSQSVSGVTNEIGFFAYSYPGLLAFAQAGTHNFDATLTDGMFIRVPDGYRRHAGALSHLLSSQPTSGGSTLVNLADGVTHTVRIGEIIGLWESNSVISNSDYIIGYDFGPETYAGSGNASISAFSWNNWPYLLKRYLDPASNDNRPVGLNAAA